MKSNIKKSTYKAIYRLLDMVSPTETDCGKLCSAACCCADDKSKLSDEESMGIYLLPGEEKLFSPNEDWLDITAENVLDYDFPESWTGKIYFVRCKNAPNCPREKRPLQCRFFPLLPHLDENGKLSLIYNDLDLPYSCPLIDKNVPLTESFIQASYTVWKRLIKEPLIYDYVMWDSAIRTEYQIVAKSDKI